MRALDLFSGIGGFALACEAVGIETAGFCEIEPFCQAVLRKHWPEVPIFPDIRKLSRADLSGIDIIVGGFPCQPYSVAGKQRGAADDRDLWPEMRRVIGEFRPRWVCAENTPGFIKLGLDSACADLENLGYEVGAVVLPALSVGAPHIRQRLLIVAHTDDKGLEGRNSGVMQERPGEQLVGAVGSPVPNSPRELFNGAGAPRNRRPESSDSSWWLTEPNVGRVAHGVPQRVDRLKALGNAVVPMQIVPILDAIQKLERTR